MKKVFIYLFVFLFAAGSSFTAKITPVKASESNPIEQNDVLEEDLFDQDEAEQAIAKESLIPEFSSEPYSIDQDIIINFYLDSVSSMQSSSYASEGFSVCTSDSESENCLSFQLSYIANSSDCYLKVIVQLANEQILVSTVYGYYTDAGILISQASEDDPELLLLTYLAESEQVTQTELQQLLSERENTGIENVEEQGTLSLNSIRTTQTDDTTVYGSWDWQDVNGNLHPLQYSQVCIYVNNSLKTTVYTDVDGYFSYTYTQTSTTDTVYVKALARGDTTTVRKNRLLGPYTCKSNEKTAVPGQPVDFFYYVPNTTTEFKGFQVSQALITGAKYVQAMDSDFAETVYCQYPSSSSYYGAALGIYLREDDYQFWDIILHEYGHFVQDVYNFEDITREGHVITEDLITRYGKDKGIRLAWGEGWSTFFAILTTQYFGSMLTNIPRINDSIFNSYDYDSTGAVAPWDENLENHYTMGEGCEASVFSVLYDFYDPYDSTEPWDQMNLSHQTMFNAAVHSGATTFSAFLTYFMNNHYSPNNGNIGAILSRNAMSSTNLRITSGTPTSLDPPTVAWTAGGYTGNHFNSFRVNIYDSSNYLVHSSDAQSGTSYTFSKDLWAQILSRSGATFSIMIASNQTNTPSTGPYYSQKLVVTKPAIVNPQISYTMPAYERHMEKVIGLAAGQYYEYLVTFESAGYKVIQTLGSKDAIVELYTLAGDRISDNNGDDKAITSTIFTIFIAIPIIKYELKSDSLVLLFMVQSNYS